MALVLPGLATFIVLTVGYFAWLIYRPDTPKSRLERPKANLQRRRRKI